MRSHIINEFLNIKLFEILLDQKIKMSFFKNKTKSIANSLSNIFKKKAVNEAGTTVAITPAKPKFRQKVVDDVA